MSTFKKAERHPRVDGSEPLGAVRAGRLSIPDPLCGACGHKRSHHSTEQPYECYDLGVSDDSYADCGCKGFSYV